MSLKLQIQQELDRLARLGLSATNPGSVLIATPNGHLECELEAVDTLGCAVLRISYQTQRLANATVAELKKVSESLASRLSYLLEPIRPVEIDHEECIVQLRSNPPQRDDDGHSYYELLARKGEISLCRYNKPVGQERRVIAAHVTREVFAKLANDLVGAV